MDQDKFTYDIAVSFAGESRVYVEKFVSKIKSLGYSVFYDQDQMAKLWGEDLVDVFHHVYSQEARYIILFVDVHYVQKHWTDLERRSAQEAALQRAQAYVLPIRLDDAVLPGIPATTGYLDSRELGLDRIVEAVQEKIPLEGQERSAFGGGVPSSEEEVAQVLALRPDYWEFFLFGGQLRLELSSRETQYLDGRLGFAEATGTYVSTQDGLTYIRKAVAQFSRVADMVEPMLDINRQTDAFGEPGEPGDADKIMHLAKRIGSLYGQMLDIATSLRGTAYESDETRRAAFALARYADQPLDSVREFVEGFAQKIESIPARLEAGEESIALEIPLVWDVPDEISKEFNDALESLGEPRPPETLG